MIGKKSLLGPLTVAVLTSLASGAAISAQQGALGAATEGNVEVRVLKDAAVKISKLNDVDFGVHNNMTNDWFAGDDFCVFSSSGAYGVTLVSSNPGSYTGFSMVSGTGVLPYEVFYGATSMTAEVELNGQLGDQADENCLNGTNAALTVKIDANNFNSIAPGLYSDTLSILVRPE